VRANGQPAFALYQRAEAGRYRAFGLQVLSLDGDRLAQVASFLDPAFVSLFGLPSEV
jgi:RNA polymerase sigma-70 factor (ECF subfamily)